MKGYRNVIATQPPGLGCSWSLGISGDNERSQVLGGFGAGARHPQGKDSGRRRLLRAGQLRDAASQKRGLQCSSRSEPMNVFGGLSQKITEGLEVL